MITEGGNLEYAPVFKKYFNKAGDDKPMPKFILFSAHKENLSPVLRALNFNEISNGVPPASMILFNFYECTSS